MSANSASGREYPEKQERKQQRQQRRANKKAAKAERKIRSTKLAAFDSNLTPEERLNAAIKLFHHQKKTGTIREVKRGGAGALTRCGAPLNNGFCAVRVSSGRCGYHS